MPFTILSDWATIPVPGVADMNQYVRDNDNYLFSGRPNQAIVRDAGSNYTTTSTAFVDIDGTNLSISLTINSGKVLVAFSAVAFASVTAISYFDFTIDGVRFGTGFNDGLAIGRMSNYPAAVSYSVLKTGLSVGSHTFRPQWKSDGSTISVFSGNGTAGQDIALQFAVLEIG